MLGSRWPHPVGQHPRLAAFEVTELTGTGCVGSLWPVGSVLTRSALLHSWPSLDTCGVFRPLRDSPTHARCSRRRPRQPAMGHRIVHLAFSFLEMQGSVSAPSGMVLFSPCERGLFKNLEKWVPECMNQLKGPGRVTLPRSRVSGDRDSCVSNPAWPWKLFPPRCSAHCVSFYSALLRWN